MNPKYNQRLKKIEGELSRVLPERITGEWVEKTTGSLIPHISEQFLNAINEPARELVGRGGKRWRPLLMVLCSELVGGGDRVVCLSPLVELPHTGSLIVDDIEDNAEWRRGKKAIHLIFGTDMAINTGNFLYFLPTWVIDNSPYPAEQKLKFYQYYAETMRRLHLGQGLDIQWHTKHDYIPTISEYLRMCAFKTGSLARLAARLGAAAGGGTNEESDILGSVAENFGVGFQMLDDAVNLTTGNPGKKPGDDIVEGKKSLPLIIHLTEKPGDRERLQQVFYSARMKGTEKAGPEIEEAINLLKESGSIQKTEGMAKNMLLESRNTITSSFPESEVRALLTGIVDAFLPA
ncbi:MAG: polyprenyl synthetase family protein [Spirochaetota bacterium]